MEIKNVISDELDQLTEYVLRLAKSNLGLERNQATVDYLLDITSAVAFNSATKEIQDEISVSIDKEEMIFIKKNPPRKISREVACLSMVLLRLTLAKEEPVDVQIKVIAHLNHMLGLLDGQLNTFDDAFFKKLIFHAKSEQAKKSVKIKLTKDPKQADKLFVYECWLKWQKDPNTYKGKAGFARDMLDKCENLISHTTIARWCLKWEKDLSAS